MEAAHFLCPRRAEAGEHEWLDKIPYDSFEKRDGSGELEFCSWCGCLKPSHLLELLDEFGFGILEHSTKQYKWYINLPDGGKSFKYYTMHSSDGFRAKVAELEKKKNNG